MLKIIDKKKYRDKYDICISNGGKISLKVPAGTQPGTVMKIAQHGLMSPSTRMGDFFVRINVSIPDNLTEEDMHVVRDISRKYS